LVPPAARHNPETGRGLRSLSLPANALRSARTRSARWISRL
jgi:hypothetical protein